MRAGSLTAACWQAYLEAVVSSVALAQHNSQQSSHLLRPHQSLFRGQHVLQAAMASAARSAACNVSPRRGMLTHTRSRTQQKGNPDGKGFA